MNRRSEKTVLELIDRLKVHDEKPAHEYDEVPKEPKKAMNALVELGKIAVEPLIGLLENASRYSCLYAIKVLGNIGDPTAVKPLIGLWDNKEFNLEFEEGYEDVVFALQRIGLPALEPVLGYLEAQKKRNNIDEIIYALLTLSKIKDERSYAALTDALSYPDNEVQEWAMECLVNYGDKRASEHIAKFLENPEWKDDKDLIKEKIRRLAEPNEYREILRQHGLVGLDRTQSFTEGVVRLVQDMVRAYEFGEEFEGHDADLLNNLSREIRIRYDLEALLEEIASLAVDEGIIPSKTYEQLGKVMETLNDQLYEMEGKYEEELGIIDWHYLPRSEFWRENLVREEKRTYKGLGPERDRLTNEITEWLHKDRYRITRRRQDIIARKGKKRSRKGCFVEIWEKGGRGRWGQIDLILWGSGWTNGTESTFVNSFWRLVDEAMTKIVGKRRFEVRAVDKDTGI